jgi:broad specificity phosphatase PhoE
MKIYLTRHGQTEWNTILRWQGNTDIELDETGIAQAHAFAAKIKGTGIEHIYASPLKRAAVTAKITADAVGAEITYRDDLKEIYLGPWEGLTTGEIKENYPEQFYIFENDAEARTGLEMESYGNLQRRAYNALLDIVKENYETVLIVSHGGWLRALLCRLLYIHLKDRLSFHTGNTGLSVVDYKNDKFTVVTLNDVSHL